MRQPGSHELFDYWNALRENRAAPERTDLDPAAMRHVLMDTFILEVDAANEYPFCLTGTRLNALFNAELKGRSFLSLWRDAQRLEIAAMLQIVTDDMSAVVGGAETSPPGYDLMQFELLLLPLRHNGKTHSRLLGRIAPAKPPVWLGLIPVPALDLKSMRVLDAADSANAMQARSTSFSRPPGQPFERRGTLRIYSGIAAQDAS
jgi:hypothetical protein